ncbi:MAG: 16S rRNA (guanine(527)-N(7))-methyltransferase RsmG [Lachnospiraceae bacterium]
MIYDMELLRTLAAKIPVELSDRMFDQFFTYYMLLIEKNKVMNLTAITQMDEVIRKHFIDSIMLSKAVDMDSIETVADMGTGAGFPGIPLKIVYPHLKITLMDSLAKRLRFLDEVIDALNLQDVETLHGRAEDIGQSPDYREKYDLCVSRAVANLSTLSEYCLPLVRTGGSFVSYKSGDVCQEVEIARKGISLLGGKDPDVIYFSLPETDMHRSFVRVDKIQKTPQKYPRKAGLPSKEPLT